MKSFRTLRLINHHQSVRHHRDCDFTSLRPHFSKQSFFLQLPLLWYIYNHASIGCSSIFHAGDVGDICDLIAVVVAGTVVDGSAAADNSRPTLQLNCCKLHAVFSSSNKAAETIERIIRLFYQLLRVMVEEFLITADLIVVTLCHCWVRTTWLHPSANHPADISYHCGLDLWWSWMAIWIKMMKYICKRIIDDVINTSCIVLILCFASWPKLWWNPDVTNFPRWQSMVDGHHSETNECQVGCIIQGSIINSHCLYAIEVYPVNIVQNFSHCTSKCALLNWLSRQ